MDHRKSKKKKSKEKKWQQYLDGIFQPLVQVWVLAPVVNQQIGASDDVRWGSHTGDRVLSRNNVKNLGYSFACAFFHRSFLRFLTNFKKVVAVKYSGSILAAHESSALL